MNLERLVRVVVPAAAVTVVLLLTRPLAGPALGGEYPLTLEEAIDRALEANEGILIERESLGAAESAMRAAAGAYDPVLQLQAGWRESDAPLNSSMLALSPTGFASMNRSRNASVSVRQLLPTGGEMSLRTAAERGTTDGSLSFFSPAYETRAGVELRQPLLRNLAVDEARLDRRVARSARDEAAASLQSTLSETAAAVESAYWTLVAARLEIGVREESVRLAEDQLEDTRDRVESGAAPETEVAQPRAELERRRGELLASREHASRSGNALKRLILLDDDGLWLDELLPIESVETEIAQPDVETSLARALAGRPELSAAESVVKTRQAERAYANDATRPRLDAVFAYDRFGLAGSRNPALSDPDPPGLPSGWNGDLGESFEMLGDGGLDDARVGLVFAIPLGNRTARADASRARNLQRQAEADLTRMRKTVRSEVLDAAAAMQTGGQRIEAARAAREAAEVQLAAERDRYEAGRSINFLVLTRQNDLSRAKLDEIYARTDYRIAVVEMARATGTLLDGRGVVPKNP